MDKKSKILLLILSLALMGSAGVTFYRYFIINNYLITNNIPCDPKTEICFYVPCTEGDNTCNPAGIEYYKKIEKNAYNIKLCDPKVDGCNPLICNKGEKDCVITFCSIEKLSDGEECSTLTQ